MHQDATGRWLSGGFGVESLGLCKVPAARRTAAAGFMSTIVAWLRSVEVMPGMMTCRGPLDRLTMVWMSLALLFAAAGGLQSSPAFRPSLHSTLAPSWASPSTHPPTLRRASATAPGPVEEVGPEHTGRDRATTHQCGFCGVVFESRNALFRHLRSDPGCAPLANPGRSAALRPAAVRQTVAFLFAYDSAPAVDGTLHHRTPEAELAGARLREAVGAALATHFRRDRGLDVDVEIVSSTQTTTAGLRHRALSQEIGAAAAGDVMVMSFLAPAPPGGDSGRGGAEARAHFLKRLLSLARDHLHNATAPAVCVELLSCKWLPPDTRLHAERSCTQRVYHYLLPLRWLPDGAALERWWLDRAVAKRSAAAGGHADRARSRPPPGSALHRLKAALKSAESATLPPAAIRAAGVRAAAGRFGDLAHKERRAWHNFADPALRGDASPSHGPVWRVLDRARVAQFVGGDGPGPGAGRPEVVAVLEFRGDDFVRQQVRRVVGTALAVAHGWLPPDVFDAATRADYVVETAAAPAGRLYLAGARFHFDELALTAGRGIFEDGVAGDDGDGGGGVPPAAAVGWAQDRLLRRRARRDAVAEEERWLAALRDTVAPRIRAALADVRRQREAPRGYPPPSHGELRPPDRYARTLALLRGIVASAEWPETSAARSAVIRRGGGGGGEEGGRRRWAVVPWLFVAAGYHAGLPVVALALTCALVAGISFWRSAQPADERSGAGSSAGSFTVVNPKFQDGVYSDRVGAAPLPRGNALFPELVEAVFELEEALSEQELPRAGDDGRANTAPPVSKRPASSHCAVNCNAQFTPHVDSGRGFGQSVSMIVGLGDYVGGELVVEGAPHDVRYRPLEFDGWRLRHWTNPFAGPDRFSLVWFTPEVRGGGTFLPSLEAGDLGGK